MKRLFTKRAVLTAALLAGGLGFLWAWPALAQSTVDLGLGYAAETGLTTTDIRTVVARIINIFLGLLGIVAVALIIYGGYTYMMAKGDQKEIDRGKKIILSAVIGLAIIMASYAIAQFILRAIMGGPYSDQTGDDNCPPGQTCSVLPPPGGASFYLTSVTPTGSGPGGNGWPKNYPISMNFNRAVLDSSATAQSVVVSRCNPRLSGGSPTNFDKAACNQTVSGTLTVSSSNVRFEPDGGVFEADYWYWLKLGNQSPNALKSTTGIDLYCPLLTGDLEDVASYSQVCQRAIAYNDQLDTQAATVNISLPRNGTAICQEQSTAAAEARDDYRVEEVQFSLVDDQGDPVSSLAFSPNPNTIVNLGSTNTPFSATDEIVGQELTIGVIYTLKAVARDPRPDSWGAATSVDFTVKPAHCCNGVQDDDEGETGVDCGGTSGCGACPGESCTEDGDCASGVCEDGVCVSVPVISSVTPTEGGAGTYVTISGSYFGSSAGTIELYQGSTSLEAEPCLAGAWTDSEIVIKAPEEMADDASYYLRLTRSDSKTTSTESGQADAYGWTGQFTENGQNTAGICLLQPSKGSSGDAFDIIGDGFGEGDTSGVTVNFGLTNPFVASVTARTNTKISAIVPSAPSASYPIQVAGDVWTTSNNPKFGIYASADQTTPTIQRVTPTAGPVESYVTIEGTGFGSAKGVVYFISGSGASQKIALGDDDFPSACTDNWHDTYIVIKVPKSYDQQCGLSPSLCNVTPGAHKIQVLPPGKDASNTVSFTVNTDTLKPGLCGMSVSSGPPTTPVTLYGDSFGSGDPTVLPPLNAVDFSCQTTTQSNCTQASPRTSATAGIPANGSVTTPWSNNSVTTRVPGQLVDKDTWPASGDVRLWADNVASSNTLPFAVQDCNDSGNSCATGYTCCELGYCDDGSSSPTGRPCDYSRSSEFGYQLSTEILPVPPRVLKCVNCTLAACSNTSGSQSPSPYINSTDACTNAAITAVFSKPLETPTSWSQAMTVETCGTGDQPATCASASGLGTPTLVNGNSTAKITLNPTSGLQGNTWYKVTFLSAGVRDTTTASSALDGDEDGEPGGNYTWYFKTKNTPCALKSTTVYSTPYTFTTWHGVQDFQANLHAENCNELVCTDTNYVVNWSTANNSGNVTVPTGPACVKKNVRADAETAPSSPVELTAQARPSGETYSRSGTADLYVRFADPTVISYFPKCDTACINAAVVAVFNTPMDESTFTSGNYKLETCRNQSCNPPFESGGVSLDSVEYSTGDASTGYTRFTFKHTANFEPDTFYQMMIRGGSSGVLSKGGKEMVGTNYTDALGDDWYVWQFQTNNTALPCAVHHASISPSTVKMAYVGQRQSASVIAYGAPDSCESEGQPLTGSDYSWSWSSTNNGVVDRLLTATSSQSVLDTEPVKPSGCSSTCLLTGSQSRLPQCGNGELEQDLGEDCDGETGCDTTTCLWPGTAPVADGGTCGNGVVDAGEDSDCDTSSGISSWCVTPQSGELGCIRDGSAAGNSVCGDGYLADGEDCDAVNGAFPYGCDPQTCLRTGSLPSCLTLSAGDRKIGVNCINFCGNAQKEPGEECEASTAGGSLPTGCDSSTCLWKGTDPGTGTGQCGNKTEDSGEDAGCDTSSGVAEWCTSRCQNAGSSYRYSAVPGNDYANQSFCGDGVLGKGEDSGCEVSTTDGLYDPFQVLVSGKPLASAVGTDGVASDTLTATTSGVASGNEGQATVTLTCTCDEQADGTAYCQEVAGTNYGCDDLGCCSKAPVVLSVNPTDGSNNVCRNAAIKVNFETEMDSASLKTGLKVGWEYQAGDTCKFCQNDPDRSCTADSDCSSGSCVDVDASRVLTANDLPGGSAQPAGLWQRISGFFRQLFGRSATAISAGQYCPVPGTVSLTGQTAKFSPQRAMPANRKHLVLVKGGSGGVKSDLGVPMANDYRSYFTTSQDICKIDYVWVTPASSLISSTSPSTPTTSQATLSAHAHAANRSADQEIVATPEYAFNWDWSLPATTSPVELTVSSGALKDNGICETGEPSGSLDCSGGATAQAPGDSADAIAKARIFSEGNPENGQDTVKVKANVYESGQLTATPSATAEVTVMICERPWPARKTDGSWLPWIDDVTNVSFYYCVGGASSGDSSEDLPRLTENPVKVVAPRADILHERLFTYETKTGSWANDAIGIRFSKNPEHLSVSDWYTDQGFQGAPTTTTVDDGYEGLQEGRTLYVNSANIDSTNKRIYTNISVLSYSQGADSATVNIFNQLAANLNMNYGMADYQYCVDASDNQALIDDEPVDCDADYDCRVDSTGLFVDEQAAWTCDADKTKLQRDTSRWGDFYEALDSLNGNAATIGYPKLEAGTLMRGWSTSAWDSWTDVLAAAVGATSLPTDPAQNFMQCQTEAEPNYDSATCWDDVDRTFQCPQGSLMYVYTALGGQDYVFEAGMEYDGPEEWAGETCWEKTSQASCQATSGCSWKLDERSDTSCQYTAGGIFRLNGMKRVGSVGASDATTCSAGTEIGINAQCGDGIVQLGEDCEPGTSSYLTTSCTLMVDGVSRTGSTTQYCLANCKWGPTSGCSVGYCGDGIVQAPEEKCDDGSLNGTYGHCKSDCGVTDPPGSSGLGLSCGDGQKQPNEACDCGSASSNGNGSYLLNGILALPGNTCGTANSTAASAPSCAWDCSGPGPRCGDRVKNGSEQCDSLPEEYDKLCWNGQGTAPTGTASSSYEGCNSDADCDSGETCAAVCDPTKPERVWRRSCGSNDPTKVTDDTTACKWSSWTCSAPGTCGNGTKETGEECDDGNDDNTDDCIIDKDGENPLGKAWMCLNAVCGDGYVESGVEQCDQGPKNGQACIPEYDETCSYCNSQCQLAYVSGGYCGDNKIQDKSDTPPGPEECDNQEGMDKWVCVSTKKEDQSYGKQTGISFCNAEEECIRDCVAPKSKPCYDSSTTNTDSQLCILGVTCADNVQTFKDDSGNKIFLGWSEKTNKPCEVKSSDSDCQPTALTDACDPDKDNDGVPLASGDCDDTDSTVYPDYSVSWTDDQSKSHTLTITAPKEICDGKDNDCNGQTDNVMTVKGRVLNARDPEKGLSGAKLYLYCSGSGIIDYTTTDSNGYYSVTAEIDTTSCSTVTVFGYSDGTGTACIDPADAETISVASCATVTVPDMYGVPRPGSSASPGTVATVYINWNSSPSDLDFYMKSSTGNKVGYYFGYNSGADACAELVWDVDDTTGTGPETMTFTSFVSGKKYKFYIHNYSHLSEANTTEWGTPRSNVMIRMFDTSCTLTKVTMPSSGGGRYVEMMTIQDGKKISPSGSTGTLTDSEPAQP